jgi:predicted dehydrogenase
MTRSPLRIALIGHAFMGAAHSLAWARLNTVYELPVAVDLAVLCGQDRQRTEAAASRFGWSEAADDWRDVVARDDVDVVDICTPVSSHAQIALAALRAGKHVICEKPLALNAAEAQQLATESERAAARGIYAMCGFNYRRVPALALLRNLAGEGQLGTITQLRCAYEQDWGADAALPMNWRFRASTGGSGALADLGSHLVDLAVFITGAPIEAVVGAHQTVVPQRPVAHGSTSFESVDVDDAVAFIARTREGTLATFEASRTVLGRKNALTLQVSGSAGTAAFDLERPNELQLFLASDPGSTAGFRRILVTEPEHPYLAEWWPPGHVLGWEHSFVHELHDFVLDIHNRRQPEPSFSAALHVQQVLDTVLRATDRWTRVPPTQSE